MKKEHDISCFDPQEGLYKELTADHSWRFWLWAEIMCLISRELFEQLIRPRRYV